MHVFEKIKLRSHDYHNHKYLVDNIAILPFYLISFPDRVHYEYKKKSFLKFYCLAIEGQTLSQVQIGAHERSSPNRLTEYVRIINILEQFKIKILI